MPNWSEPQQRRNWQSVRRHRKRRRLDDLFGSAEPISTQMEKLRLLRSVRRHERVLRELLGYDVMIVLVHVELTK